MTLLPCKELHPNFDHKSEIKSFNCPFFISYPLASKMYNVISGAFHMHLENECQIHFKKISNSFEPSKTIIGDLKTCLK